jgi:hypothetical protein
MIITDPKPFEHAPKNFVTLCTRSSGVQLAAMLLLKA